MARPSKITDKQFAEIEQRHLAGESIRGLAREFDIAEAALRKRIKTRANETKEIKEVAAQIVATEQRFAALPINAQISARTLADELKAISLHMASAAKNSAMTSHRLSILANNEAQKIDDADPMQSETALKGVAALTRMSNDAATIPLGLMSANKEMLKEQPPDNLKPMTLEEFYADTESGT